MNLQPDTKQARQPGGRFGTKLPSPAPLTAAQELARLDALRNANGGWLVPPPAASINDARMVMADSGGQPQPNQPMLAVLAWFESIVAAGGTPADMNRAWQYWQPPYEVPRVAARDRFDEMLGRAEAQTVALRKRAEVEARPQRAVRTRQYELALAERALCEVEARYHLLREARDVAKAKLDEAADAAAEAA